VLFERVLACWAPLLVALSSAPAPDLGLHLSPPKLLWVEPDGQTPIAAVEPDQEGRPLTIGLVSTGLALGVLAFGTGAWWEDGLEPFSIRETGFFGEETYAGGSDKWGHMFASLVTLRIVANVYKWLGLDPVKAAWGSALFTTVLFNGFELIDGFTEFGFEYGDVVMNTIGVGFGLAQLLVPHFDDLLGMRIGYVPTRDFLAHDKSYIKFINDYTGMLFVFDLKLKGALELGGFDPGVLRFVNIGAAWGTDNYSPIRRSGEEQRLFGPQVSINFAEVLRAISDGDEAILDFARVADFVMIGGLSLMLLKDLNGDQWYLTAGISNRFEIPL
jgi:hypothetical protein